MDISYTNELLGALAKENYIDALIWGRAIYDRFMGFRQENTY